MVAQSIATSKLPASGYTHTYFHTMRLDLFKLSTFPSDLRIDDIAATAMDEVDNILSILGINPFHLHSIHTPKAFPSIDTWFLDSENDDTSEAFDDDQELEGTQLNRLIDLANSSRRILLTNKDMCFSCTNGTGYYRCVNCLSLLNVYLLSHGTTLGMTQMTRCQLQCVHLCQMNTKSFQ